VKITTVSKKQDDITITPSLVINEDYSYSVTYIPHYLGHHLLTILVNNRPIKSVPYDVVVGEGTSVPACTVGDHKGQEHTIKSLRNELDALMKDNQALKKRSGSAPTPGNREAELLKELQQVKSELSTSSDRLRQSTTDSKEKEKRYLQEIDELKSLAMQSQGLKELTKEQMMDFAKGVLASAIPWFGIEVLKAQYEKKDQTGVQVVAVKPLGPAETAGLQEEDLIQVINSERTAFSADFAAALLKVKPGDIAVVQARRGLQRFTARVEIGTKELSYRNVKQVQRIATGVIMIGDEEFIITLMKREKEKEKE